MFTKILVALDGGPQHAQVLDLAGSLAGPSTRLHLLCVLDPAFALADDAPPVSVKADRLEFPDDITLEEGMRESLRACIRQWLANHATALDGRDPEGVHQMRVALRRSAGRANPVIQLGDVVIDPATRQQMQQRTDWGELLDEPAPTAHAQGETE